MQVPNYFKLTEILRNRVFTICGQQRFGLCAGEFTVPDDFHAPLPEEPIGETSSNP
jgi:hypothetical protein